MAQVIPLPQRPLPLDPQPRATVRNPARAREWSLVGGLVWIIAALGGLVIARLQETGAEAGWRVAFERPELGALDIWWFTVVVAGAVFLAVALYGALRSQAPRTDAFGAGLTGAVLSTVGGVILFLRLLAVLG